MASRRRSPASISDDDHLHARVPPSLEEREALVCCGLNQLDHFCENMLERLHDGKYPVGAPLPYCTFPREEGITEYDFNCCMDSLKPGYKINPQQLERNGDKKSAAPVCVVPPEWAKEFEATDIGDL